MNETVTSLLQSKLAQLHQEIDWERESISQFTVNIEEKGKRLDRLNLQRREILDHLAVNGYTL